MKIGSIRFSGVSLALLLIQLAIVSTIAAKYLYQRWTCPRVWTRASAYDPELVMRGRYLSLQLTVDGCGSTLPSAKEAEFPRDVNGAAIPGKYTVRPGGNVEFQAVLTVDGNRLKAIRLDDPEKAASGHEVTAWPGQPCDRMRLDRAVNFYISDHARSPLPLKQGNELWIEVTVPPKGPPRPIQLALKESGAWTPLTYQ